MKTLLTELETFQNAISATESTQNYIVRVEAFHKHCLTSISYAPSNCPCSKMSYWSKKPCLWSYRSGVIEGQSGRHFGVLYCFTISSIEDIVHAFRH